MTFEGDSVTKTISVTKRVLIGIKKWRLSHFCRLYIIFIKWKLRLLTYHYDKMTRFNIYTPYFELLKAYLGFLNHFLAVYKPFKKTDEVLLVINLDIILWWCSDSGVRGILLFLIVTLGWIRTSYYPSPESEKRKFFLCPKLRMICVSTLAVPMTLERIYF